MVRRFPSIWAHTAHIGHYIDVTLQGIPKQNHVLGLLVENDERKLQKKDNQTWEPTQRMYVPDSSPRALAKAGAYTEVFLRHLRCAWTSKGRAVTYHGRRQNMLASRSTSKHFSMNIGLPRRRGSWHKVSRIVDHPAPV